MRLLKPSPGEVIDRQTILQLKAKYGQSLDEQLVGDVVEEESEHRIIARTKFEGASKVNIQIFLDEHEALQRYLEKNYFPEIERHEAKQIRFEQLLEELAEVNQALWLLEDQARILRDAPDRHAAAAAAMAQTVLFDITRLNDKRANLVQDTNLLWDIYGKEKLY